MSTAEQTSLTERNREVAEQMYAAIGAGDVEKFLTFISPDVVVEEPPFLSYGGTYRGLDGLQQVIGNLGSTFDLGGLVIERITVDGDIVFAQCTIPLQGSGEVVTFTERVQLVDGKAAKLRVYMYDAASLSK
jgi:ketosteroid isomerase-like protein